MNSNEQSIAADALPSSEPMRSDAKFDGDYFADPKWLAAAIQIIRDDIENYPAEMRAALYGIYNLHPPSIIE